MSETANEEIVIANHGQDLWTWAIRHNFELYSTSYDQTPSVFPTASDALHNAVAMFKNDHDNSFTSRTKLKLRRKYVVHFMAFWFYTICAFIAGWFFGATFGFKALVF